MKINKEDVEQLEKFIVEIVSKYVVLKKVGDNFKGLCPFHEEKTPSFTVNPAGNSYYCFGCKEEGDIPAFIRAMGVRGR
jgi:DNA primase